MNVGNIRSGTIALLATAALVWAVGATTDNTGFQWAGGLMLLGGGALAFRQARSGVRRD